jgi:hypothetical protein
MQCMCARDDEVMSLIFSASNRLPEETLQVKQAKSLEQSHVHAVHCRYQRLKFRHNLYKLREERNIKPSTFGELVSSMLYEKR